MEKGDIWKLEKIHEKDPYLLTIKSTKKNTKFSNSRISQNSEHTAESADVKKRENNSAGCSKRVHKESTTC